MLSCGCTLSPLSLNGIDLDLLFVITVPILGLVEVFSAWTLSGVLACWVCSLPRAIVDDLAGDLDDVRNPAANWEYSVWSLSDPLVPTRSDGLVALLSKRLPLFSIVVLFPDSIYINYIMKRFLCLHVSHVLISFS